MTESTSESVQCAAHPDMPAAYCCQVCGAYLCEQCALADADGTVLCSSCEQGNIPLADEGNYVPPGTYDVADALAAPAAQPAFLAVNCQRHQQSPAIACCRVCRAPVCATCAFIYDSASLCPACATSGEVTVSPTRLKMGWWSVGLAIWNGFMLAMLVAGAFATMLESKESAFLFGIIVERLSMAPAFIGLGLACGALHGRSGNHWAIWAGLIGNGVTLALWFLLIVVGMMNQ